MHTSSFLTIHLATDHAGFTHKEAVRGWLVSEGFEVIDHGASVYDAEDDFPLFIGQAAKAVLVGGDSHAGVVFGGSGQGEAMAANRIRGIRAGVYYGGPETIVTLTREHNNANILSLGARFMSSDEAKRVIWTWLHTSFLGDKKYQRRNVQIDTL
jgi:ribose 5-phosphate isomerase B